MTTKFADFCPYCVEYLHNCKCGEGKESDKGTNKETSGLCPLCLDDPCTCR